jgi:outer membrane protein OmpA-like peptidoglycan-associated protein
VTATGDDGLANNSWTAPVNDGGAPIDGYIVTANPGGATCTAVAPSTTCTISGLTNGTEYTFTVVATNNVGNSIASNPSSGVTPGAAASAPDYVQGTPSNHSVLINWKAPTTGPAPTTYTVTVSPGGQTCTIDLVANSSASLRCNFTGLTNGTPYTFTVTGTLANGNSSSDTITVVPNPGQFKPSAPRQVVFRGSVTGVATVTWLVSASNGGSAITKYVVYVNGTRFAKSCTVNMAANPSATLKCTFTGLKPKRFYNYRVAAVNAIGQTLSAKAKRAIDVNVRLVSFARNKYTMWQGLYRQAFITASYIKKFKYTKVVVTGYTNPGGPLSARTSFTQARALTVANYLTRQLRAMGVKGVTISATGTGASLYKHPNAAQRKLNRSVGTLLSYK